MILFFICIVSFLFYNCLLLITMSRFSHLDYSNMNCPAKISLFCHILQHFFIFFLHFLYIIDYQYFKNNHFYFKAFYHQKPSKTLFFGHDRFFEKQLPTLDYFVHLQCFKRPFSKSHEKITIIKPTNN